MSTAAVVSVSFTLGEAIELGAVSSPVGIDATENKLTSCFFRMSEDASAAAAAFFLTLVIGAAAKTHTSEEPSLWRYIEKFTAPAPEINICSVTFGDVIVGRRAKIRRVGANSLKLHSNEQIYHRKGLSERSAMALIS